VDAGAGITAATAVDAGAGITAATAVDAGAGITAATAVDAGAGGSRVTAADPPTLKVAVGVLAGIEDDNERLGIGPFMDTHVRSIMENFVLPPLRALRKVTDSAKVRTSPVKSATCTQGGKRKHASLSSPGVNAGDTSVAGYNYAAATTVPPADGDENVDWAGHWLEVPSVEVSSSSSSSRSNNPAGPIAEGTKSNGAANGSEGSVALNELAWCAYKMKMMGRTVSSVQQKGGEDADGRNTGVGIGEPRSGTGAGVGLEARGDGTGAGRGGMMAAALRASGNDGGSENRERLLAQASAMWGRGISFVSSSSSSSSSITALPGPENRRGGDGVPEALA
jgi:hypothetical protein